MTGECEGSEFTGGLSPPSCGIHLRNRSKGSLMAVNSTNLVPSFRSRFFLLELALLDLIGSPG
jgi:hypothetical protein